MQRVLEQLTRLGMVITIDDFGTGYSSLSELHQLPVQRLKIDRIFIHRLEKKPADMVIIKAILDLADAFSLTVIAEGIETDKQCKILQQHGTQLMQGYYFSKPLSVEAMTQLLQKNPQTT